jgi:hypothetical protein
MIRLRRRPYGSRRPVLALPHETPRLMPEPRPLDLVATTEYEPLAAVVERQRARADRILALPLAEREQLARGVMTMAATAATISRQLVSAST